MKKIILLATIIILALGLTFAWADDSSNKDNITIAKTDPGTVSNKAPADYIAQPRTEPALDNNQAEQEKLAAEQAKLESEAEVDEAELARKAAIIAESANRLGISVSDRDPNPVEQAIVIRLAEIKADGIISADESAEYEAIFEKMNKDASGGQEPVILDENVNESEPNNDCATAATMACGDRVFCASVGIVPDTLDFFSFTLDNTYTQWDVVCSTYTAGTDCGVLDDVDTKMWLYNENCTEPYLAYSDDDGPGLYSRIIYSGLAPGIYKIKVGRYGTGLGNYHMRLTCGETPAPLECPPGATAEGEGCGNNTNGGCNTSPTGPFGSIDCGETVCGSGWGTGGTRDTDWYMLGITTPQYITITVTAAFPFVFGVIEQDGPGECDNTGYISPYATGLADETVSLSTTVPVSVGWPTVIFVAPSNYYDYSCTLGDTTYFVTVTCEEPPLGACCYNYPGTPICDDLNAAECAALGGIWTEGAECATFECPITPANDLCVNAQAVTGPYPVVIPGTTFMATGDNTGTCGTTGNANPGVWYSVTGTGNTMTVDLCNGNTSWDSKIQVWCNSCAFPICVGGNDDFCGAQSQVSWCTELGTEYLVIVYQYSTTGGSFDLTVSDDGVPCSNPPLCEPQPGACCYGDPVAPSCIADVTQEVCFDTYDGYSWVEGGTCPESCPPVQEGENCAYPKVIASLPYNDAGNTCGFSDDCNISGSNNSDVIYEMVITTTQDLVVSLCGSSYDTKLAIYLNECCTGPTGHWLYNDDNFEECGSSASYIAATFNPGTYYIVVDGYSTYCGDYVLYVGAPQIGRCCYGDPTNPDCADEMAQADCVALLGTWTQDLNCEDDPCPICVVECPTEGIAEGEPDCGIDYDDTYNGGCNSTIPIFQPINSGDVICGTSGTFLFEDPANPGTYLDYRDTDWFEHTITEPQVFTWTGIAEFPLLMFIMNGTAGCASYTTVASGSTDVLCEELTLQAFVPAGTYWFWIGPSVFGDTYYNCPKNYVASLTMEDPPPPPPNDLCDNAIPIAIPSTTLGSTTWATLDDAPTCVTTVTAPGIWYSLIGNGDTLTATTCNAYTTYDTKLCVYFGDCADLVCVTGNDDNCTAYSLRSTATWCSEVGVEYLILVHGFSANVGDFQLDIIDGLPCEPPIGRCCYGDFYDPTCVDNITLYYCATTYSGVWTVGLNCTDNPCDTYGHFDVDPDAVEGSVDAVGPGNIDTATLTVSNSGSGTLDFTVSVSIDAPAPINASDLIRESNAENSGLTARTKSADSHIENIPDPNLILQGGDNIASATVIGAIPYSDNGTTSGYLNDYNEDCPYTGSTAPDVVYSYAPAVDEFLDISLCNSLYDTKLFVYEDAVGTLVGCNDDACGTNGWRSQLLGVHVFAGHTYYIIVDGYSGTDFGTYYLDVINTPPPPTGRCCDYTDPLNPDCTDGVYQADCSGAWAEGLNCIDNPCPEIPHCDEEALVGFTPTTPDDDGWSFGFSDTYNMQLYDNYAGAYGTIEGIKFWGVDADIVAGAECDEDPMTFIISFFADDGAGNIGGLVYTETVDILGTLTGLVFPSGIGDIYSKEYEVTFASSFVLDAGWVSIVGHSVPTNSCIFAWNNSFDPAGDDFSWLDQGSGPVANAYDFGFCLMGTYEAPWLTVDTDDGSILAGGAPIAIGVTMDAEDLECEHIYTGSINFASNDPLVPSVSVPVAFEVCMPTGACCVGTECVATNTESQCTALSGIWHAGQTCPEYECGPTCFEYLPGDVNMAVMPWPPAYLSGDVTYLVNYFRGLPSSVPCKMYNPLAPSPDPSPCFFASADVNGSCTLVGADVTKLVNVFRGITTPASCPSYVPCWPTPANLPPTAPAGWPNCVVPCPPVTVTGEKVIDTPDLGGK